VVRLEEEVKKALEEIREELRRLRQAQEDKERLIPKFVESSPVTRTYGQYIDDLINPRFRDSMQLSDDLLYYMGHFDQELLDKLTPIAKRIKIISPEDTLKTAKNKDALRRISKDGAEVRLHPMLHARILLVPKRNFLIVGSGDLQTNCLGGNRFDAGIKSNYPELIGDALNFFNRVWNESEPLKV